MQAPPPHLLVTCEHAANAVPERWMHLFADPAAQEMLRSHRGWDPGAADAARHFAQELSAPCLLGEATRLLVDLNRSLSHPQLWSECSRGLPPVEKEEIVRGLHDPFRRAARTEIDRLLALFPAPVYHLSVHSFVPELDGEIRNAEIGLLYDPSRPLEVRWATAWETAHRRHSPQWRVRHNYPYLGTDDGHPTHLRTQLPPDSYAGLELEINQSLVFNTDRWPATLGMLAQTLAESLRQLA